MSLPISRSLKADTSGLTRRGLLAAGAGTVFISAFPFPAHAAPEDMKAAIRKAFGEGELRDGRVSINTPPIAENGYSVPITVTVESPMSEDDHVREIGLFSPRNPVAHMAHYYLGPRAGRAEIATRIRMAGTQDVMAVAKMNDGTLWSAARETVVTLAACVVL